MFVVTVCPLTLIYIHTFKCKELVEQMLWYFKLWNSRIGYVKNLKLFYFYCFLTNMISTGELFFSALYIPKTHFFHKSPDVLGRKICRVEVVNPVCER